MWSDIRMYVYGQNLNIMLSSYRFYSIFTVFGIWLAKYCRQNNAILKILLSPKYRSHWECNLRMLKWDDDHRFLREVHYNLTRSHVPSKEVHPRTQKWNLERCLRDMCSYYATVPEHGSKNEDGDNMKQFVLSETPGEIQTCLCSDSSSIIKPFLLHNCK